MEKGWGWIWGRGLKRTETGQHSIPNYYSIKRSLSNVLQRHSPTSGLNNNYLPEVLMNVSMSEVLFLTKSTKKKRGKILDRTDNDNNLKMTITQQGD